MTASIPEIEADLARSRAALRENLSALASRLSVKHVIGDVILTPGFLAGAAKVALPFVLAGAGGALIARGARAASLSARPGKPVARPRPMSALLAGLRHRSRDSASRTLLLAAAAVALAGGAAAALPLTRRERKILSRPLRFAAEQAAEAGRTISSEAQALSDSAAAFARKPDGSRNPVRFDLGGPSPTIVSAS